MTAPVTCPTCDGDLVAAADGDGFRCSVDHEHTVVSLVESTNLAAVRALWRAIRALEDDARSLEYMASRYGDAFGMSAEKRLSEATEARADAQVLRELAQRAQVRLDAVLAAPLPRDAGTAPDSV